MDKQTLINIFKGGLTCGSGNETVELLINKQYTTDNKLCLEAYDANMMGLLPYSWWSKSTQNKCKQEVLRQTKEYNITVEVDDTVIKEQY